MGRKLQAVTWRGLHHPLLPSWPHGFCVARDFNRRDWNIGSKKDCWERIVVVGEIAYSRPPNTVSSVMWWRRQCGFRKELLRCLGLVKAIEAHRRKVARKCDRHARSVISHLQERDVADASSTQEEYQKIRHWASGAVEKRGCFRNTWSC